MGKVLYPSCCFCKQELKGFGNDPFPLRKNGRCCDSCNLQYVTLVRYLLLQSKAEGKDADQIIKLVKDKMKADFEENNLRNKDREEAVSSTTNPEQS